MDQVKIDPDEPITLAQYAEHCGRSLRSVARDVKANRIPVWRDTTKPYSPKMTSLAAIEDVRRAQAEKAVAAFKQKAKLS